MRAPEHILNLCLHVRLHHLLLSRLTAEKTCPATLGLSCYSVHISSLFFAVGDQRPHLNLQCSSKYRTNGTFQVTLKWSITPSVRDLQAIHEFQVIRQVPHNTSKETVTTKVRETLSTNTHKRSASIYHFCFLVECTG